MYSENFIDNLAFPLTSSYVAFFAGAEELGRKILRSKKTQYSIAQNINVKNGPEVLKS